MGTSSAKTLEPGVRLSPKGFISRGVASKAIVAEVEKDIVRLRFSETCMQIKTHLVRLTSPQYALA